MNTYFFSIFLLCSISCDEYNEKIKTQGNEYVDSVVEFKGNDDGDIENSYGYHKYVDDRYEDEEYVGNPDFDAIIERPCRVFDLNCIRKYFAEHSKCKIRRGPLPDRFFISQESLYFTRVNMTATPTNFMVNGFRNTRVEEFYINRRTNKMVFSIQVRFFSTNSPSIYLQFYRVAREPIVIVPEGGQLYQSATLTAVIPNIDDLQLKEAEITAFSDSLPAFFFGPELLNNTDPTVAQSLLEFLADVPTNVQESFLTDSQYYLPAYIQFNICDFRLSNK